MKIVEIPNFSNDKAFVVAFTINKALLPYSIVHLLLDKNKIVQEVSSSCSSHLGITFKDVKDKTININEIVHEFEEIPEKKPTAIKCNETNMKCIWNSIITSKKVLIGYHVMLELQRDEDSILNLPDNPPPADFQFSYSLKYNKYIGGANIEKSPYDYSNQFCILQHNCNR
jgi:hypothetical protein